MSETGELRKRVEAKKKELEAELERFGNEQKDAADERQKKIRAKLDELEGNLKQGWDDVSESVAGKLNRSATIETGSPDREANMWRFAAEAFGLLQDVLRSS